MTSLTCSCYAPLCHHPISLALGSRPLEQPLSGVLSDACAGLKSFFQSWPLPWPPHFFVAWACLMPVGRGSACGTAHQSVCLPCARSVRQWDPACPVSHGSLFPVMKIFWSRDCFVVNIWANVSLPLSSKDPGDTSWFNLTPKSRAWVWRHTTR